MNDESRLSSPLQRVRDEVNHVMIAAMWDGPEAIIGYERSSDGKRFLVRSLEAIELTQGDTPQNLDKPPETTDDLA